MEVELNTKRLEIGPRVFLEIGPMHFHDALLGSVTIKRKTPKEKRTQEPACFKGVSRRTPCLTKDFTTKPGAPLEG